MSDDKAPDTSNPDESGRGEITDSASSEYASTDESRDEASDAPGSGSTTEADDEAGGARGRPADDLPKDERDELESERAERLDPDNRPDNAEVDNTGREFDATRGQFTDTPHDDSVGPFDDPEDPNNDSDGDPDGDSSED
jgi:hypothetical protein